MGKYLEEGKFVIAVCGTHGKSTTTAMIAQVLEDANLDPTVELGAIVPKWGHNFRVGKSKFFVTEADEFNNNFLSTTPDIAVVTNIEMDHPEFFESFEDYKDSFIKFLTKTKRYIVANLSDPNVAEVIKIVMKECPASCVDYTKSDFNLKLKVPGEHNLLNAKAAFQVGLSLGLDSLTLQHSLDTFTGISRRMEQLAIIDDAIIYSDFGHHPTEVRTTIEGVKQKFPDRKITLIFQPHMFSRTKALFPQFVTVFQKLPADQIYISDIYQSRERDTGLVSSKELVEAVEDPKVMYLGKLDEADEIIKLSFKPESVIVFMGAGDIDTFARELVK